MVKPELDSKEPSFAGSWIEVPAEVEEAFETTDAF